MKTAIGVLAVCSLLCGSVWANNNLPSAMQEVTTHAQQVQKTAMEISSLLKNKLADRMAVEAKLNAVHSDVVKLKEIVANLEGSDLQLTPAQKQEWDRLRMKVELLYVFAKNKKDLLESGDLNKNRSYLRAHAEGIAKRAAMLQQTAAKL